MYPKEIAAETYVAAQSVVAMFEDEHHVIAVEEIASIGIIVESVASGSAIALTLLGDYSVVNTTAAL